MKNNEFLKTQVGMLGAYRIIIREKLEMKKTKAKELLTNLKN